MGRNAKHFEEWIASANPHNVSCSFLRQDPSFLTRGVVAAEAGVGF